MAIELLLHHMRFRGNLNHVKRKPQEKFHLAYMYQNKCIIFHIRGKIQNCVEIASRKANMSERCTLFFLFFPHLFG